jgi:hypothetical protein
MKIQIQENSKDKITWLLRAVDKDANTMLQIHTLLLEAQNNKELRAVAAKQPPQNVDNFKPIARSVSQNSNNEPVNPYLSPNSLPQIQQQIQPSNIQPPSTLQGGLIRADSLQSAQMTNQTGTQSPLNNLTPNQKLPNQQNQFGQQNQMNQFGQLNQMNPTN